LSGAALLRFASLLATRVARPPGVSVADLVLASGSPRRHELLASIGLAFSVEAADIDESALDG
jgi:Maf-like protein